MKIRKNFIICLGDMSFWKLGNWSMEYERKVAVLYDVTEAVMKISGFPVCYESNKHTFIKTL